MGHFLSYGDYLGFNQSDSRGAIEAYEEAWNLLSTPWQQQTGGADILAGIADFALRSEDPDLAAEVLDSLVSRANQIADASLREVFEKLTHLSSPQE